MPLSSYCRNCGAPNTTVEEMSSNHCNGCETVRSEAIQHAAAQAKEEKREVSQTDLLYIGRQAMLGRAHHPRQGVISPKDFNSRTTKPNQ